METTDNFHIAYPTGPDDLVPLQTPFAVMASSIDAALLGLGGQVPMLPVANAAERDAIYPNPTQGDSVVRKDKGWTEMYYALYNSTQNPGGTISAGWFPVFGKLPRITVMRATSDFVPSGEAFERIVYNSVTDTVGNALSADTAQGRVTATTAGRYHLSVANNVTGESVGYVDTQIRRGGSTVLAWNTDSIDANLFWITAQMDAEVVLAASQYVEVYVAGNPANKKVKERGTAGSYFSVQYVSPPFPNNS